MKKYLSKKKKRLAKKLAAKRRRKLFIQAIVMVCALLLLAAGAAYIIWRDLNKPPVKPPQAPIPSAITDLRTITHGDTSKKEVIFTFDAGGTAESGNAILAVLAKHHVKGTFFMTGKMVEENHDFVKNVVAGGNEIFNHTYDHKDLTTLSNADIATELTKMNNILQSVAGISTKPYFRAPYGAQNERVLAAAAKAGYRSVYWSEDAMDWEEPNGETAVQVKERILSSVAPGTIYLMHVGDNITGAILDNVFNTIESRGYKIVSLTQGL